MRKKPKYSIENVYRSLSELDLGCCWFNILRPKYKKIIGFDNDERGNGKGPYLEIKFYSEYVKIHRGDSISNEEKKIIFPYCDYNTVDDFADYLGDWIRKYFKSFKYVRIKK